MKQVNLWEELPLKRGQNPQGMSFIISLYSLIAKFCYSGDVVYKPHASPQRINEFCCKLSAVYQAGRM